MVSFLVIATLLLTCSGTSLGQRSKSSRNIPVGAELKATTNFNCPEEFGYYPHPTDCTQYYVCVFGGALLESCTGGLMYSHELQTCDWPRNVGCDGTSAAEVTAPATSTSNAPSRSQESRTRYTPPPPLPQPAAVVTSRGQPRPIQHHTQEIIKQHQQQLYAEAEETLPPAEEIESDRQQRVYRGQPSTVGQVQRDRDGLRHTNAIPSYSGRGEKIGVISFGTQQQSIPQYRTLTDEDFLLTNDLTNRGKSRRKRQAPRRHPSVDVSSWQSGILNKPHNSQSTRPPLQSHFSPLIHQHQSISTFRPSVQNYEHQNQEEFRPFIPINYKQYHTHTVANTNGFAQSPRPITHVKPQDKPQENYSYFKFGGPVHKTPSNLPYNRVTNNVRVLPGSLKIPLDRSPVTFPPLLHGVYKTGEGIYIRPQEAKDNYFLNNNKTFINFQLVHDPDNRVNTKNKPFNHEFKLIDGIISGTEYQEQPFGQNIYSSTPNVIKYNQKPTVLPPKYEEENGEEKEESDGIPENIYKPPINKYENIENPFADPNFDFDKFLDKLRSSHTQIASTTPNIIKLNPDYHVQNKTSQSTSNFDGSKVVLKTPVPFLATTAKSKYYPKSTAKNPPVEYYYYDDEATEKPNSHYSSQVKLVNSYNRTIKATTQKPSNLDDDYYYEEYEYDDDGEINTPGQKTSSNKPLNSGEQKYSSKYQDKEIKTTSKPVVIKYVPVSSSQNIPSSIRTNPLTNLSYQINNSDVHPTRVKVTTSTPKTIYTIRQRPRPTTTLATPTRTKGSKHRLTTTTTKTINHDTRLDQINTQTRVEVTTAPPVLKQSVSSVTPRNYYNTSSYDSGRYDPYYTLYEDDVELYRDVDYSQNFNNNGASQSNQQTYRGTTAPATQSPPPQDIPKRGNTAYVQNTYNSEDVYQQPSVPDYNDNDNSYNSQVYEQNNYKQSSRQPLRGDRNELNYVEESTTKRITTTTTTTPRPIPTQKSTVPQSRPAVASNVKQTQEQLIHKTIQDGPGYPTSNPSIPDLQVNDSRHEYTEILPVTYRPPVEIRPNPLSAPTRAPVVNLPSPFTLPKPSTTEKPITFHFITKPSVQTSTSTTERPQKFSNSRGNIRFDTFSNKQDTQPSGTITPTTYAPPRFFLKSTVSRAGILHSTPVKPYVTPEIPTLKPDVDKESVNDSKNVGIDDRDLGQNKRRYQNVENQGLLYKNVPPKLSIIQREIFGSSEKAPVKETTLNPKKSATEKDAAIFDGIESETKEQNPALSRQPTGLHRNNKDSSEGSTTVKTDYYQSTSQEIFETRQFPYKQEQIQFVRVQKPDDRNVVRTTNLRSIENAQGSSDDKDYKSTSEATALRSSTTVRQPQTSESFIYERSTRKPLYRQYINKVAPSTEKPDEKYSTFGQQSNKKDAIVSSFSLRMDNKTNSLKLRKGASTTNDRGALFDKVDTTTTKANYVTVEPLRTKISFNENKFSSSLPSYSDSTEASYDLSAGSSSDSSIYDYSSEESSVTEKSVRNEKTKDVLTADAEIFADFVINKPVKTVKTTRKFINGNVNNNNAYNANYDPDIFEDYNVFKVRFSGKNDRFGTTENSEEDFEKPSTKDYLDYSFNRRVVAPVLSTTKASTYFRATTSDRTTTSERASTTVKYSTTEKPSTTQKPSTTERPSSTEKSSSTYRQFTSRFGNSAASSPTFDSSSILATPKYESSSEDIALVDTFFSSTTDKLSDDLIRKQLVKEKVKEYIQPKNNISSLKPFRNTVEVPSLEQIILEPEEISKYDVDQPPSYKPKPILKTKDYKPLAGFPKNTTTPRASRVNTAIKSLIANGEPRRQNINCNEQQTPNDKCNDLKQRSNTRGRGSAHYTSNNAVSNNVEAVPVNRGTPAPRSRPTLKPSTSIVSKASEFIDIYRYPPRRPDPIYPTPQPDKTAAKCRKDVCLLPDCSCGGKEIPGDLPVEQVPQIVLLTFDDSVNDLNKGLYTDLFEKDRVNPNGCPIAATFYVSHEWTDYSQVQNLYSDGHEIASHTVSHSFGEQFSQKKWTREIAGQREILAAYGGVHLEDVRGMRAPFLSVGGNKMFKMLYDSNFTYDSSMPIYENKPPSWPYTLDYKLFHDCMIPPCPTRSYPGVWEVPMVMWQDLNGGRCSMGDACSNPSDSDGVFKMIMKNFERHYTSNRAPFGLFYHAAWFTQPHHKEGFIKFMDTVNQYKDVYFLTNWQAIQWVRDPTPLSRIGSFQPFQCNYANRPKRCNNPKVCNLWHKSGVRYMRTCQPCPDIYPWTGNTGIRSSRIDNDIED